MQPAGSFPAPSGGWAQVQASQVQSVKYLGHIISQEGEQADPSKIEKVVTWPNSDSTKEVQRFLGFVSYYRRFIQDFAEIAKLLHQLTEKAAPFRWTAQCQAAFEE